MCESARSHSECFSSDRVSHDKHRAAEFYFVFVVASRAGYLQMNLRTRHSLLDPCFISMRAPHECGCISHCEWMLIEDGKLELRDFEISAS